MDPREERRGLLQSEPGVRDPDAGLDVDSPRSEHELYLSKVDNSRLFLSSFAAVLGPLSFGFVLGFSSPAIPDLKSESDPRLRLDDDQASWFGSIVTLGAAVGGLLGGWMVQRFGRKLTLMLASVPFVGGFSLIVAAQNVWMLHLGRVLTGIASGVTSLVVPLYISETAHERLRGLLGSCVQLMVVIGIMGVYLAGLVLGWRWLAVCSSIPPALMLLLMCFMPETPRYLVSRGRSHEAEAALRFLRGPEADVTWEIERIEESAHGQSSEFRGRDLCDPGVFKPLLLGVGLMIFQQMSGINAIMFYAESIFEEAHFENGDLGSVLVGVTQVVFTAVAAVIMDRAGRRLLLIVSGASMALSTAAFGVYFYLLNQPQPQTQLAWLALLSMGVFITGFALGWGPVPWLVMSEILPVRVRGFAGAVCVLTNWTMAFTVTKTFQDLMSVLTAAGTFWLFSFMCVLNLLFTTFCLPETKGKSLEEIEDMFTRSGPD